MPGIDFGGLDLFSYKTLTGIIRLLPPTPEEALIGSRFMPYREIDGVMAEWEVKTLPRTIATEVTNYDGPSKAINKMAREKDRTDLVKLQFHKIIKSGDLVKVLAEGSASEMQFNRLSELLTSELEDLRRYIYMGVEYWRWQCLTGTLSMNVDGVTLTKDTLVPSTHTSNVAASWSAATTDIITDIRNDKELISKASNKVPTTMVVTDKVQGWLANNTGIKALMGEQWKTQIGQTGRVNRLLDLDVVTNDVWYTNSAGTTTHLWAGTNNNKYAIFTGVPLGEVQRGVFEVPSNAYGVDGTSELVGNRWSFLTTENINGNVQRLLYAGETMMTVVTDPNSVVFRSATA